ncbi:SUMO-conjugating enzyme UBC9 [Galdieria sulphuraria]|uniref:Ubiquitin-conjugating enzyme 29 n=1 Tax=Galdieria sulphuraria TaxID=130081 RepID=M2XRW4_GALSU|nr:ubiquitin-conjugating enzyme 29 [Galdieria sulphuraria]EME26179.1 ubiquitin-conjugating enzyme 29 [Galdieria sulphuraria]GJD09122.1 SUMO-conjugating enzyme UBC9 [Galdieria sulphuraria]|eukprot:XP_005702699.1 ubiquitin-conjugating enzyme 29 [Galdieria sulphuraria]
MAFVSNKRLYNDLVELSFSDYPKVSVDWSSVEENCSLVKMNLWCENLSCPYNGFILPVTMEFVNYPHSHPFLKFEVDVFHPNVYQNGNVCLNILSVKEWSPGITLRVIFITLLQLLAAPNASDSARSEAGEAYMAGNWEQQVVQVLINSNCKRI